jgi:hypothetical protein
LNFEFFYSNLKIDNSIMKNCYFNFLNNLLKFETWYLNLKILIWIWYFQFKKTDLILKLILNSKLIFSNPKISISIQKIIIDHKHGIFWIFHLILNILMWIWKFIFQLWNFFIYILNNHLIWTWNLDSKLLF